jgi:tryptophan synthase beta subunit
MHYTGAQISARGGNGRAGTPAASQIFVVNVSGRGDKDIDIYRENFRELDEAGE